MDLETAKLYKSLAQCARKFFADVEDKLSGFIDHNSESNSVENILKTPSGNKKKESKTPASKKAEVKVTKAATPIGNKNSEEKSKKPEEKAKKPEKKSEKKSEQKLPKTPQDKFADIFSSAGKKDAEPKAQTKKTEKKQDKEKTEKKQDKEKEQTKPMTDVSEVERLMKSDNKKRPRERSESIDGPSSDEEPVLLKKRKVK